MNFAQTVRNKRKAMGLTQKQLADIIQYRVLVVSRIENEQLKPSLSMAVKLALALNISITIEGYG